MNDANTPPQVAAPDLAGALARLRHPEPGVRAKAIAECLACVTHDPRAVVAALAEVLRRADPWTGETWENRLAAVNAIGALASHPPDELARRVAPVLVDALWDPSRPVRAAAAQHLQHVHTDKGGDTSYLPLVPELQARYDEEKTPGVSDASPVRPHQVPHAVMYSWWRSACDPRVGRLLAAELVRLAAAAEDAKTVWAADSFLRDLAELTGLPDPTKPAAGQKHLRVRLFLLRAWRHVREPAIMSHALASHIAAVQDPYGGQDELLRCVREELGEADIPFLAGLLQHKNPLVRRVAATWLGELRAGPHASVVASLLGRFLTGDGEDTEMKEAALRALARWGKSAVTALPRLRELVLQADPKPEPHDPVLSLARLAAWVIEETVAAESPASDAALRLRAALPEEQTAWVAAAERWVGTATASTTVGGLDRSVLGPAWRAAVARAKRWLALLKPGTTASSDYLIKPSPTAQQLFDALAGSLQQVVAQLEQSLAAEG